MTENAELGKVIEKIQKLLALSESSNEHEAALAAAKASDLLMKYELTMEQVGLDDSEVDREHQGYVNTTKAQRWEQLLAHVVAQHNFCVVLVGSYGLTFVGKDSERKVAVYVYQQLARILHKMARKETSAYIKAQKTQFIEHGWLAAGEKFNHRVHLTGSDHHKSWRAAWLDGAVIGIRRKLQEQRDQHLKDEASFAIVKVRDAEVDEYMQENYPNLGHHKSGETKNWSAYAAGVEAGSGISINPGLSGEDQKKIR